MTRKLHDYQQQAIDFLSSRPFGGLFADMGTGKTACTLHSALGFPRPILLVGPIRVIETVWGAEALEWPITQGLSFSLVRGTPKEREKALAEDADIYLVNPELLDQALASRSFNTLIVDESSMFKNPSSKRFKKLRKYLSKINNRYILTGTPTPRSLMDIWSQMFIVDLGERLGTSFYRFRDRFFRPADYMGYTFVPVMGAEEKITKLISDVIFRISLKRNEEDKPTINKIPIPLPGPAWKIYEDMEKKSLASLLDEEKVSAPTAAAALMKLRQIASGFVYNEDGGTSEIHREKIEALKSVVAETGSPILVIYQFVHELEALKKAFPKAVVFDSDKLEAWNDGGIDLMFLHPQSGGHGINLQHGGHTLVVFSGTFSYEQMAQTIARIDRQGQKFHVIIHFLLSVGTVDELIFDVFLERESNQTRILERIKQYAAEKVNHR